ncbi:1-aminocyclopropane-1-carboxylate synthase [Exophiala viscosa]|uniref:1-aminocyclopropane-1-carboxylate synthase n=1 Tax=Exophiala viscosa TaxID=2486360 RepID=A0AAN6IDU2_9EURO|nr:1-aminocyclopropane-1-carboxylate synthase [Exophiala viscosa]
MSSNAQSQLSTLSSRAQAHAHPGAIGSPLWDVVNDLWHPQDNPNGYVNLGIAENLLMHHELEKHIAQNFKLPLHAFTYGNGPLGSKRLKTAVARFLNRRLEPVTQLEAQHIVITNGTSHSIEHTSWAFCNPGDGFLLGQPYYGAFLPDIALRPGVEVVKVPLKHIGPMNLEAVEEYESVLLAAKERGVTVRALMLCNPHNPLGRCYSREVIIAYMRLCQRYQIHLVSDEIYAFSVWKNERDAAPAPVDFVSALSIPLDSIMDPALLHVLWGVSKDFGANGLRVGFVISQHNEAFRQALLSVAIYSYASSVSEHIVANILEDDAWVDEYIRTNQARLAESYAFVVDFLRKHDITYTPGANAAFFIVPDLGKAYLERHGNRKGSDADNITGEIMQLLMKNKVFLTSGPYFGAQSPGLFRLVFSQPREVLDEGLKRMLAAIS